MKLCDNCLERTESSDRPVPVGEEHGSQRDPYRNTLDLCSNCSTALVNGDLDTFHERYSKNTAIDRSV